MSDTVREAFLDGQMRAALALDADSDVVTIVPCSEQTPASRYVVHFDTPCLVGSNGYDLQQGERVLVAINFSVDCLRRFDTTRAVALLAPCDLYHPNVRWPVMCLGDMPPGTGIVEIVYQVFEVISWTRATVTEFDALNHDACAWARANQHRIPLDSRPLRRHSLDYEIERSDP